MNSENDPTTSRPPYHPGVQTTNWLPPCWTVPSGQVPVWPTVATNQFGQVVQQPICFMGQLPTAIQQQQQPFFQTPFQFTTAPDPVPVKQESVNPGHQGRGRGRRGGSFRRGGSQSFRNRTQIRQDPPVQVRAPQTEAEAEEVRQWITQRKKNFPRLENPKRQDPVGSNSERAKELKNILTRQQEMGVTGIAGTEKLLHQMGSNRPDCSRRGPNGVNKRRRFDQSENQGKRILQKGSFGRRHIVKKPMSLLEKILYKETRQQKSHALQCIRFLVENNFLQDLGKKPLVFPCESEGEEEQQTQDSAGSGSDEEESENQAEMKSQSTSEDEDNDSIKHH